MNHNKPWEMDETPVQINIEYSMNNETRLYYNFENKTATIGIGRNERRSIEELVERARQRTARITEEETEQNEKD